MLIASNAITFGTTGKYAIPSSRAAAASAVAIAAPPRRPIIEIGFKDTVPLAKAVRAEGFEGVGRAQSVWDLTQTFLSTSALTVNAVSAVQR